MAWAGDIIARLREMDRIPEVRGVTLLGSLAASTNVEADDVDTTIIISDRTEEVMEKVCLHLLRILNKAPLRILHHTPCTGSHGKFTVFLKHEQMDRVLKLDAGLTTSLRDVARLYRCSRMCAADAERAVIYDRDGGLAAEIVDLLEAPLPHDYSASHYVEKVLELYYNAVRDVRRGDMYRAEFHLFLIRHHLLSLECLLRGTKDFYLPRHAWSHTPQLAASDVHCSPATMRAVAVELFKCHRAVTTLLSEFPCAAPAAHCTTVLLERLDEDLREALKQWPNPIGCERTMRGATSGLQEFS